jgi:hypothetical protein
MAPFRSRIAGLAALSIAIAIIACQASTPLEDTDGAARGGTGSGGAGGAGTRSDGAGGAGTRSDGAGGAGTRSDGADGGVSDDASNPCGDPMPYLPCDRDSDCRNPYLACGAPTTTLTGCRDVDAGADPACPQVAAAFDNLPVCPATAPITHDVCNVRYQSPCVADTDCGPAGFTCASGRCQERQTAACASASDCPTGWDCYVPCECPGLRETKACEPPFAELGCPLCPVQK